MPSPFLGMDIYLETPALWSDFHARFITYWRDALIDCLPSNYEARIDEKVHLVEVSPPRSKRLEPDVAVSQRRPPQTPSPAPAGVATLEPVPLSLVIEEEAQERHIEILHRPDHTLVAVLELLSPANKRSSTLAMTENIPLTASGGGLDDSDLHCQVHEDSFRLHGTVD